MSEDNVFGGPGFCHWENSKNLLTTDHSSLRHFASVPQQLRLDRDRMMAECGREPYARYPDGSQGSDSYLACSRLRQPKSDITLSTPQTVRFLPDLALIDDSVPSLPAPSSQDTPSKVSDRSANGRSFEARPTYVHRSFQPGNPFISGLEEESTFRIWFALTYVLPDLFFIL